MFQARLSKASWGLPAALAALVWALVAGSVTLWWLHLPRQWTEAQPGVTASAPAAQDSAGLLKSLGHTTAQTAAPDVAKRFVLLGVIAADSGQGSALLAVDGQPAKAFVQGQAVVEGWRLETLTARGVRLSLAGSADNGIELRLPARP